MSSGPPVELPVPVAGAGEPDDDDAWVELRYISRQVLPDAGGVDDELDTVALWDVESLRCRPDGSERSRGSVGLAVWDLGRPAELLTATAALGGDVARAARVLLDDTGRVHAGIASAAVDRVVLFVRPQLHDDVLGSELPLHWGECIRARLGGDRALVASVPHEVDSQGAEPTFFRGLPAAVVAAWQRRGIRHAGDGVYVLPAPVDLGGSGLGGEGTRA